MINFTCPNCKKVHELASYWKGEFFKCDCGNEALVGFSGEDLTLQSDQVSSPGERRISSQLRSARQKFVSGHTIAKLAVFAHWVLASLSIAAIPGFVFLLKLYSKPWGEVSETIQALLIIPMVIGEIITPFIKILIIILFTLVVSRAYQNLPSLGVRIHGYSLNKAVIKFIIPVSANEVLSEIWKGSNPNCDIAGSDRSWITAPSTPLINLWWIFYMISIVLDIIRIYSSPITQGFTLTPTILKQYAMIELSSGITTFGFALFAIFLIRKIDYLQNQKNQKMLEV